MIYLIGVSHRVQAKPKGATDTPDQLKYREALTAAIKQVNPALVGEEYSEFALGKQKKDTGTEHESLTKQVADAAKVQHRYCDPEAEAREKMGYIEGSALPVRFATSDDRTDYNERGFATEVVKYWPLREQFWLDQLHDVVGKDVVFVCGDAHLERFAELSKKHGISSTVVSRHIGLSPFDDEWWNRIQAYVKAHPEV